MLETTYIAPVSQKYLLIRRPILTTDNVLDITKGRHPLTEMVVTGPFIPNSTCMEQDSNRVHVITGRQLAVLILPASGAVTKMGLEGDLSLPKESLIDRPDGLGCWSQLR